MVTTLTPRQEEVVLFQGDDEARINELAREIDDLRDQLKRARQDTGGRRSDRPSGRLLDELDPVEELTERLDQRVREHDDLVEEATPRAVRVMIVAIGRKVWRGMTDAHPPREGKEEDETSGLNEEGFAEDAVRACMLTPAFDSTTERDQFLDSLSDAQFNRLYLTAIGLNRVFGATPKAMQSSRPSPNGASISV